MMLHSFLQQLPYFPPVFSVPFFSSVMVSSCCAAGQLVQFSVMLFFSVDSQLFPAFIFFFLYTELVVHFLHYGFFDFSREIFIIFLYRLGNQTVQKQLKPCPLSCISRPRFPTAPPVRFGRPGCVLWGNHYLHAAVREHRTDRLQLKPCSFSFLISLNCSTSSLV